MIPEILYEDNHLIVVLKPAGLLTQGDISGAPSLLDGIREYVKQRDHKPGNAYLGLVQRLDRPVSGVMIFAKTSKAAARLSSQLRNRQVGKLYAALTCSGNPAGFTGNQWLAVENHLLRVRDKTIVAQSACRGSQHGLLRMKTLYGNKHGCFHLIALITGRKHQIRAQLAHRGLPVRGDRKYGAKQSYQLPEGIGLHALCCRFEHPVSQEQMVLAAPLPDGFTSWLCAAEAETLRSLLAEEISEFAEGALLPGTRIM